MNFGKLIKELRIARQLTLRQCCAELGVDPSNWSKMERGVTPPPKDTSLLDRWARFLGVTSEKNQEFLDLAFLARREIPPDMASDEKVIAALPAFFRAVRGQELEGARFKQFIEDVRAVHSPDKRSAS
jgi:transcriptional regulator with XRE-family HTH domain